MSQVLLACMGSKAEGCCVSHCQRSPLQGSLVTLLILVEQWLPQTIATASRSHPKGSKLAQVGPYFWPREPTCRNDRMKNPSKIAHIHLQTVSSNHRLNYECCSKSSWL